MGKISTGRLGFPTMATVDPERERQRLADSYAGQMDDELKAIATKATN